MRKKSLQLKNWYAEQSQRDKRVLALLITIITPLIIYFAIFQPLNNYLHQAAINYREAGENLVVIKEYANAAKAQNLRPVSPEAALKKEAGKSSITLKDIVVAPNDRINFTIDNADFNQVLELLETLSSQYALVPVKVEITRLPEEGYVSATVSMAAIF